VGDEQGEGGKDGGGMVSVPRKLLVWGGNQPKFGGGDSRASESVKQRRQEYGNQPSFLGDRVNVTRDKHRAHERDRKRTGEGWEGLVNLPRTCRAEKNQDKRGRSII